MLVLKAILFLNAPCLIREHILLNQNVFLTNGSNILTNWSIKHCYGSLEKNVCGQIEKRMIHDSSFLENGNFFLLYAPAWYNWKQNGLIQLKQTNSKYEEETLEREH